MKNKQTFFLIILLFSFFLSCNENDSEIIIEPLDSNHVQNRSLDCECEATITNINDDFKIITELYYFAEICSGIPPLPSDPSNCNGCNFITTALLDPGESASNALTISNMFNNSFNEFVIFVQPVGTEEPCPEVNVVIDCGGNQIISQNYTLPATYLNLGIERYVKIAQFVNEQTDPDWDGTPWTGTWEESCSLIPTLQWWNFPCKNPEDAQLITPCWPNPPGI